MLKFCRPLSFGIWALPFLLCSALGASMISQAQAQSAPFHDYEVRILPSPVSAEFIQQSSSDRTFDLQVNVIFTYPSGMPPYGFRLIPVGEPQGLSFTTDSNELSIQFGIQALAFSLVNYRLTLLTEGVDGQVEFRVLAPDPIPAAAVAHDPLQVVVRAIPVLTAVELALQPQPGLSDTPFGSVLHTTAEEAVVVMGFSPVYSSGSAAAPAPVSLDLSALQVFGSDTLWTLSATALTLRPGEVTTVTLSVELPVFGEAFGLLLSSELGSGRPQLLLEQLFRFHRIPMRQLRIAAPTGIRPVADSSYTLSSLTVTASDALGAALEPTGISLIVTGTGRIMPLQQSYALEFVDGIAHLPDIELNLAAPQTEQIVAADIFALSTTRSYTVATAPSTLEYSLQGVPAGYETLPTAPTVLLRADLLGLNATLSDVPSEVFANQRVYIVEPEFGGIGTALSVALDSASVGADAPYPLQLCLNIELLSLSPPNLPFALQPGFTEEQQGRSLGSIRSADGGDGTCRQYQLSLAASGLAAPQLINGQNAAGDEIVVARSDRYSGLQLRVPPTPELQSALIRIELREPQSGLETAFEILVDPGALLHSVELGLDPAEAVAAAAIMQPVPGAAVALPLLFTALGFDGLAYNSNAEDLPLIARIYPLENISIALTSTAGIALDRSGQRYLRTEVNFALGRYRHLLSDVIRLQQQGRNGRLRIELRGADQHGGTVPTPFEVEVRALPVISGLELEAAPFHTSISGQALAVPLTLRLRYVDAVAVNATAQLFIAENPPPELATVELPADSRVLFSGALATTPVVETSITLPVTLNSTRDVSFAIGAELSLHGYSLSTTLALSIVYIPPLQSLTIISSSTLFEDLATGAIPPLRVTVRAIDARGGLFDLNDSLVLRLLGIDNFASFNRRLQFVGGLATAELNLQLSRPGLDALLELDLFVQDSGVEVRRQPVRLVAVPVLEHIEVSIVGPRQRTVAADIGDALEVVIVGYAVSGEVIALPALELLVATDGLSLFQGLDEVTSVMLVPDADGPLAIISLAFNALLPSGYRSASVEFTVRGAPPAVRISSATVHYRSEVVLATLSVSGPTAQLQAPRSGVLEVTLMVTARGSDGMDWGQPLPALALDLVSAEPPLLGAGDIAGFDGLLDFGSSAPYVARRLLSLHVPPDQTLLLEIGVAGSALDSSVVVESVLLNLRGVDQLAALSLALPARVQQSRNAAVSTFVITLEARDRSGEAVVPEAGLRLSAVASGLQSLQFEQLLRFDSSGTVSVVVSFLPLRGVEGEARFSVIGLAERVRFSAANEGRVRLLPTPEFAVELRSPLGTRFGYYSGNREVELEFEFSVRQLTDAAFDEPVALALLPGGNAYFRELSLSGNRLSIEPRQSAGYALSSTLRLRIELLPGVLSTSLSFSLDGGEPSAYRLNLSGDTELELVLLAEQLLSLELAAGVTSPTARADAEPVAVPLQLRLSYRGEGRREIPAGLRLSATVPAPGEGVELPLDFESGSDSAAVTVVVVLNSSRATSVRLALSGGNPGTVLPAPLLLEIPFIPLPARYRLVDNGAATTFVQQGSPDEGSYVPVGANPHYDYQWQLLGSDGRPYSGPLDGGLVRPPTPSQIQYSFRPDIPPALRRSLTFRYDPEEHGHLQFHDRDFITGQSTANYHCNTEHLQHVELFAGELAGGANITINSQTDPESLRRLRTEPGLQGDVGNLILFFLSVLDLEDITQTGHVYTGPSPYRRSLGLDQELEITLQRSHRACYSPVTTDHPLYPAAIDEQTTPTGERLITMRQSTRPPSDPLVFRVIHAELLWELELEPLDGLRIRYIESADAPYHFRLRVQSRSRRGNPFAATLGLLTLRADALESEPAVQSLAIGEGGILESSVTLTLGTANAAAELTLGFSESSLLLANGNGEIAALVRSQMQVPELRLRFSSSIELARLELVATTTTLSQSSLGEELQSTLTVLAIGSDGMPFAPSGLSLRAAGADAGNGGLRFEPSAVLNFDAAGRASVGLRFTPSAGLDSTLAISIAAAAPLHPLVQSNSLLFEVLSIEQLQRFDIELPAQVVQSATGGAASLVLRLRAYSQRGTPLRPENLLLTASADTAELQYQPQLRFIDSDRLGPYAEVRVSATPLGGVDSTLSFSVEAPPAMSGAAAVRGTVETRLLAVPAVRALRLRLLQSEQSLRSEAEAISAALEVELEYSAGNAPRPPFELVLEAHSADPLSADPRVLIMPRRRELLIAGSASTRFDFSFNGAEGLAVEIRAPELPPAVQYSPLQFEVGFPVRVQRVGLSAVPAGPVSVLHDRQLLQFELTAELSYIGSRRHNETSLRLTVATVPPLAAARLVFEPGPELLFTAGNTRAATTLRAVLNSDSNAVLNIAAVAVPDGAAVEPLFIAIQHRPELRSLRLDLVGSPPEQSSPGAPVQLQLRLSATGSDGRAFDFADGSLQLRALALANVSPTSNTRPLNFSGGEALAMFSFDLLEQGSDGRVQFELLGELPPGLRPPPLSLRLDAVEIFAGAELSVQGRRVRTAVAIDRVEEFVIEIRTFGSKGSPFARNNLRLVSTVAEGLATLQGAASEQLTIGSDGYLMLRRGLRLLPGSTGATLEFSLFGEGVDPTPLGVRLLPPGSTRLAEFALEVSPTRLVQRLPGELFAVQLTARAIGSDGLPWLSALPALALQASAATGLNSLLFEPRQLRFDSGGVAMATAHLALLPDTVSTLVLSVDTANLEAGLAATLNTEAALLALNGIETLQQLQLRAPERISQAAAGEPVHFELLVEARSGLGRSFNPENLLLRSPAVADTLLLFDPALRFEDGQARVAVQALPSGGDRLLRFEIAGSALAASTTLSLAVVPEIVAVHLQLLGSARRSVFFADESVALQLRAELQYSPGSAARPELALTLLPRADAASVIFSTPTTVLSDSGSALLESTLMLGGARAATIDFALAGVPEGVVFSSAARLTVALRAELSGFELAVSPAEQSVLQVTRTASGNRINVRMAGTEAARPVVDTLAPIPTLTVTVRALRRGEGELQLPPLSLELTAVGRSDVVFTPAQPQLHFDAAGEAQLSVAVDFHERRDLQFEVTLRSASLGVGDSTASATILYRPQPAFLTGRSILRFSQANPGADYLPSGDFPIVYELRRTDAQLYTGRPLAELMDSPPALPVRAILIAGQISDPVTEQIPTELDFGTVPSRYEIQGGIHRLLVDYAMLRTALNPRLSAELPPGLDYTLEIGSIVSTVPIGHRLGITFFDLSLIASDVLWTVAVDSPAGRVLTIDQAAAATALALDIITLDRREQAFAVAGGLRLQLSVESGTVQSLPSSLVVGSGRVEVPLTLGAGNTAVVRFEIDPASVADVAYQPENVSFTPLRLRLSAAPLPAVVLFEPQALELIQSAPSEPVIGRATVQVLDSQGRTLQRLLSLGVALRADSGVVATVEPTPLLIRGIAGVSYSILPLPGEDTVVTLTVLEDAMGSSDNILAEVREQQLRIIAAEVLSNIDISAPAVFRLRPDGGSQMLRLVVRVSSSEGISLRPEDMVLRVDETVVGTAAAVGETSTVLLSFSGRDSAGYFAELLLPVDNPPAGVDSSLTFSIEYQPYPGFTVRGREVTRLAAVPQVEALRLAIDSASRLQVVSGAEVTAIGVLVELEFTTGSGFRPQLELLVEPRLLAPVGIVPPPGLLGSPVRLGSDSEGRGRAAFAAALGPLTAATLGFEVSAIGRTIASFGTNATLTLVPGVRSSVLQLPDGVPTVTSLSQSVSFRVSAVLDYHTSLRFDHLLLASDSDPELLQVDAPTRLAVDGSGGAETTVRVTFRRPGQQQINLRLLHPDSAALLTSLTVTIPYRPLVAALELDFSPLLVQSSVAAPFTLQLLGTASGNDGLPYTDNTGNGQSLFVRITTSRNSRTPLERYPLAVADGVVRLAGGGIAIHLLEPGLDGSLSFVVEGEPLQLAPVIYTVQLLAVEIPERLELEVLGFASRRVEVGQFSNFDIQVRGIGSKGNLLPVTGLTLAVEPAVPGSVSILRSALPFDLNARGLGLTDLQLRLNPGYDRADVDIRIAGDAGIEGNLRLRLSNEDVLALFRVEGIERVEQQQSGTALVVTLTVTALDSDREVFLGTLLGFSDGLSISATAAEHLEVEFVGGSSLHFTAGVATLTAVIRLSAGRDSAVLFGLVGAGALEVEEHRLTVVAREVLERLEIIAPRQVVQTSFLGRVEYSVEVRALGSKGGIFLPSGLSLVISTVPAGVPVTYVAPLNFELATGLAQLQVALTPRGIDVQLDYSINGGAATLRIDSNPTQVTGVEGLQRIEVTPLGAAERGAVPGMPEELQFSISVIGTKGGGYTEADFLELFLQVSLGDDLIHEQFTQPLVVDSNGQALFTHSLLLPVGATTATVVLVARTQMRLGLESFELGRGQFTVVSRVAAALVEVRLGQNELIQTAPGAALVTTVSVRVTGTDGMPFTPADDLFALSLSTAQLSFSVDPPRLRFVAGVAMATLTIIPTPGEDSSGAVGISGHRGLELVPRVISSSYTLTAAETLRLLSVELPPLLVQREVAQAVTTMLRVRAVGSKGTMLTPAGLMLNYQLPLGVPAPQLSTELLTFDRADAEGAFAEVSASLLPAAGEDTTISFGVVVGDSYAANYRLEPGIVGIRAAPLVLSAELALLEGTELTFNRRSGVRASTLSLTFNYSGGSGGRSRHEVVLLADLAAAESDAVLLPPLQRLVFSAEGRAEAVVMADLNGSSDAVAIFTLQGLPHGAADAELRLPLRYEAVLGRAMLHPVAPVIQARRGAVALFDIVVNAYDLEDEPFDPVGLTLVPGAVANTLLLPSFDGSLNFSGGSAGLSDVQIELIQQGFDGELQLLLAGLPPDVAPVEPAVVTVLAAPMLVAVEVIALGGNTQEVLSDHQRKLIELSVALRYNGSRSYPETSVTLTARVDDNAAARAEFVGSSLATHTAIFSAGARNATLTLAVSLNGTAPATIVLLANTVADNAVVSLPTLNVVLVPQLTTLTLTAPEVVRQSALGAAFTFAVDLAASGSDGRDLEPAGLELLVTSQANSTPSTTVIPLNFSAGRVRVAVAAELLRPGIDGELQLGINGLDAEFDFAPQTVVLEALEFLQQVEIMLTEGPLLRQIRPSATENLVLRIRAIGNRGGAVPSSDLQLQGRVTVGSTVVQLMPDAALPLSIGEEGFVDVAVAVTLLEGGVLGRVNWSVVDGEGVSRAELDVDFSVVALLSELRVAFSTDTLVQQQAGQELAVLLNIAAIDTEGGPYTLERLSNLRLRAVADDTVEVRFEPPSPTVVDGLATATVYIRPLRGLDSTVMVMAQLEGDDSLTFVADSIGVTAVEIPVALMLLSSSRLTAGGEQVAISVEMRLLGSKNGFLPPTGIGLRFNSAKSEFNRVFGSAVLDRGSDEAGYFARLSTTILFVADGEDIEVAISALPSAMLYPSGIRMIPEVSTETIAISPQLLGIELSLLQNQPLSIPDLSGVSTATLQIARIYSGGSGVRPSVPLSLTLTAAFADAVPANGAMITPQSSQLSLAAEAVATVDFSLTLGTAMSATAVFSVTTDMEGLQLEPLHIGLQRLEQLTILRIAVLSPITQSAAGSPLVFSVEVRAFDRLGQPFNPQGSLTLNLLATDNTAAPVTTFPLQFVNEYAQVVGIEVQLMTQGVDGSVDLTFSGQDPAVMIVGQSSVSLLARPVIERVEIRTERVSYTVGRIEQQLDVEVRAELFYVDPENVFDSTVELMLSAVSDQALASFELGSGGALSFAGGALVSTLTLGVSLNSRELTVVELEIIDSSSDNYGFGNAAYQFAVSFSAALSTVTLQVSAPPQQVSGERLTVEVTAEAIDSGGAPFNALDSATLIITAGADSNASLVGAAELPLSFVGNRAVQTFEVELLEPGIDGEILLQAGSLPSDVSAPAVRLALVAAEILSTASLSFASEPPNSARIDRAATVTVDINTLGSKGSAFATAALTLNAAVTDGAATIVPAAAALNIGNNGRTQAAFAVTIAPGIGSVTIEFSLDGAGSAATNTLSLVLQQDAILYRLQLALETTAELEQQSPGEVLQTTVTVTAFGSDGEPFSGAIELSATLVVMDDDGSGISLPPAASTAALSFSDGVARQQLLIVPSPGRDSTAVLTVDVGTGDSGVLIEPLAVPFRAAEILSEVRIEAPSQQLVQQPGSNSVRAELIVRAISSRGQILSPEGLRLLVAGDSSTLQFEPLLIFDRRDELGSYSSVMLTIAPNGVDRTLQFGIDSSAVDTDDTTVTVVATPATVIAIPLLRTIGLQGPENNRVVANSIVQQTTVAVSVSLGFSTGSGQISTTTVMLRLEVAADSDPRVTVAESEQTLVFAGRELQAQTIYAIQAGPVPTTTLMLTVISEHPTAGADSLLLELLYRPVLQSLSIEAPAVVEQTSSMAELSVSAVVTARDRDGLPFSPAGLSLTVTTADNVRAISLPPELEFENGTASSDIVLALLSPGIDGAFTLDIAGAASAVAVATTRVTLIAAPHLDSIILSVPASSYTVLSDQQQLAIPLQITLEYLGTRRYPELALQLLATADSTMPQLSFSDAGRLRFEAGAEMAMTMLTVSLNGVSRTELILGISGVPGDAVVTTPALSVSLVPELAMLEFVELEPQLQTTPDATIDFALAVRASGSDGRPFDPAGLSLVLEEANNTTLTVTESALRFSGGVAELSLSAELLQQGRDGSVLFTLVGFSEQLELMPLRVELVAVELLAEVRLSAEEGNIRTLLPGRETPLTIRIETVGSKGNPVAVEELELAISTVSGEATLSTTSLSLSVGESGVATATFAVTLAAAGNVRLQLDLLGVDEAVDHSPLSLTLDTRLILAALVIETAGESLLQDTVGAAVSTEVRIIALDSEGNRFEDVPTGLRLSAVDADMALQVSGNEQELVFTAGVATVVLNIVPAAGLISMLNLSIDGLAVDSQVMVSSRLLQVEALELVELQVELPPRLQQGALGEAIEFVLAVSTRGTRGNLQLPTGLRVSNQTSSVTVSFGNGSSELVFVERGGVGYSTLSITALPLRGEDSTLVLSFSGGDGRVIELERSVLLEAVAVVTEIRLREVADSIMVFSSTDIAELPVQLELEFSAGSAGREPVVVELEARAVPGSDSRVVLTRARSRVELIDGSSTETRFAVMLGGASRADILVNVVSHHPDLAVVRILRLSVVLQPVLARLEITAPMALNEQAQGGDIVFAATVMAFDRDDQPFEPTGLSLSVVAVDSNTAETDSENFALSFGAGSAEVAEIRSRLLIPGDSGGLNLTVTGIDDGVEVEAVTVELLAIPLLLGVSLSADGGPWSAISDSEELALTVRAELDYIGSSRYRMTTLRLTASSDSTATGLVFPEGAVLEFEEFGLEATTTLLITLNENRAAAITLDAVGAVDNARVQRFDLRVDFSPQLQTLTILPVASVQQPSPGSSLNFDVSLTATGSDGRSFRPLATFLEVSGENNATPVDGRFALDFDSAGRAQISGIEVNLQEQGQDGQLRLSVSGVPAGIEVAELLVDLIALQTLTRLTLSVRDGMSEREVPSGEAQTLIIDLEGRGSKGMPFSHDSPDGEVVISVLSGELEIPVRAVPFQLTNGRTEALFRVTLRAGDRAVVNIGLSGIDTTNLELLPSGGLELVLRRQGRLSRIQLTAAATDYTQQIAGLPARLSVMIRAFDELVQPLAVADLMLQVSASNEAISNLIPAIVDVPAEGTAVELLVLPEQAIDTSVTVSLLNIDQALYSPLEILIRAAVGDLLEPLIIDAGNSSGRPGLEELIYTLRWQAGTPSSEVEEEDVANLRLSTSSITAEGVDNLNRLFVEDEVPGGTAGSADTNRDNRADEIDVRILIRYRAGLRCAALGDNIDEALVRRLLGLDPTRISNCP